MNCALIAEEIQHNLDFLASPLRNVAERHRSMRAVFDYSWKLLTPQEQATFRKLAVFHGGFEREAAEQIADASLTILTALVDKSLLQWNANGRYDLHELLRQYAEQQLEASGESAAARAAHSAYYINFLAERDDDVKGRRQQEALHEIQTDFENIRAGWHWAIEEHRHDLIQRSVLDCLINVAEMNNQMLDVQAILKQTTATFAPMAGETPLPVWEQAVVRREWLNYHLTISVDHWLVEAILERARERGDEQETAWCLWVLADYAQIGDDYAHSVAIAHELLALRRGLGDEFYIAHALACMFSAYLQDDQLDQSLQCVREGISLRRKLGDIKGLGFSLASLGTLAFYDGRFAEAETSLDQGLTLQETFGKTPGYVTLLAYKAILAFWRGEFELAAQFTQLGVDFAQGQDYLSRKSLCLVVLSFIISLGGDYARGLEFCQQTGANYRNDRNMWTDWGLALAWCGLGDNQATHRSLQATLRRAVDSVGSSTFQWICLPIAAILAARDGQPERAVELLGLAYVAPPELTGWMGKWALLNEVRQRLETELGDEVFKAAWERGAALELETVVAELRGNAAKAQPEGGSQPTQTLTEPISAREVEVLRLLADGLSNAEIGQKLFISVATVKVHTRSIYGKLGVNNRTQAVTQAQKLNLL